MVENNGITVTPAPEGYRGKPKGSDVTTYDLKIMDKALIEAYGLLRYLREKDGESHESN